MFWSFFKIFLLFFGKETFAVVMNGILQVVQFLRDISVAMLHSLALLSPNVLFIYLFILTRYHCHTVFIVCREVNSTSLCGKGKVVKLNEFFYFP